MHRVHSSTTRSPTHSCSTGTGRSRCCWSASLGADLRDLPGRAKDGSARHRRTFRRSDAHHCARNDALSPACRPAGPRCWSAGAAPPRTGRLHRHPSSGLFTLTAERVGSGKAVLAGRRFRVRGVIQPFVAGQQASVRFYRGDGKLAAKRVAAAAVEHRQVRVLRPRLRDEASRDASPCTPRTRHAAARHCGRRAASRSTCCRGAPARARAAPSCARCSAACARSATSSASAGVYDARTARAVLAFRKVTGHGAHDDRLRRRHARARRAAGALQGPPSRPRPPHRGRPLAPGHRAHRRAAGRAHLPDLVGRAGTPTILGSFRVYLKTPGTNAKGMVHSAYFIRGYAIHGYPRCRSIRPATAACACRSPTRVSIFNWIGIGTPVDVYYG